MENDDVGICVRGERSVGGQSACGQTAPGLRDFMRTDWPAAESASFLHFFFLVAL